MISRRAFLWFTTAAGAGIWPAASAAARQAAVAKRDLRMGTVLFWGTLTAV